MSSKKKKMKKSMPDNKSIYEEFSNLDLETKTAINPKRKKAVNGKKKGNRVELYFAKAFTERFKKDFKRAPMSGGWGTFNRQSDLTEAKEVLSSDLVCPKNFLFSVEIKSRATFNFWDMLNEDTQNQEIKSWINQVELDAKSVNKKPLLIIKINNKKPFVLIESSLVESKMRYGKYSVLRFDYFLKLKDEFFFEKEK